MDLSAPSGPTRRYRITLRGHLPEHSAPLFEDLTVESSDGVTVLVCDLVDQAQLQGVLGRLRDLHLELVSLAEECVTPDSPR